MSGYWRNHIERLEQLLEMAKADGTSVARRLSLLYEAVVQLTAGINDLETHRNDE